MTLVIPQGFAHVVHSYQQSGDPEPMAMTYGIEAEGIVTASDLAVACDAAADALMAVFSNQLTLINTEVRFQGTAPPADPTIGAVSNSQVGSGSDPIMPQNTAFLIHKRTAVGGRGGRGRMYQPGVPEGTVNTIGQLTVAQVNALQVAYNTFLDALENHASIAAMVILHDSEGANAADDPHPVTSLVVDPIVATQRRRLRR